MTTTPEILISSIFKEFENQIPKAGAWVFNLFFQSIWKAIQSHWPLITITVFVLLIVAVFKALLGRVGMIGSLAYHLFYFSFIGIIIAIKGFQIVFNPFYDLVIYGVYLLSFYLTGKIIKRF